MLARLAPLALALTLPLAACKKDFKGAAPAEPATEAEARAIAERYVEAMMPCDEAAAGALIDYDALARLAVTGLDAPTDFKNGFVEGLKSKPGLCDRAPPGDVYTLLHVLPDGDNFRPVIRVTGDEGVNYEELVLGKAKGQADVKIRDLYQYITGERMSESIRSLAESSAPGDMALRMVRMRTAMDSAAGQILAGNAAAATASLDALPADMQRHKTIMLLRVTIGGMVDDATYLAAIEAFEQAFPGDPAIDLVAIDGHYLRKDWPAAHAALDKLDQRVGGDPYLETIRANMLVEAGDYQGALAAAQRAMTAEPTLEAAWWSQVFALLRSGDHAGTAAAMTKLADTFGATFDPAAMAEDPAWAEFLASDAYRQWSAGR